MDYVDVDRDGKYDLQMVWWAEDVQDQTSGCSTALKKPWNGKVERPDILAVRVVPVAPITSPKDSAGAAKLKTECPDAGVQVAPGQLPKQMASAERKWKGENNQR